MMTDLFSQPAITGRELRDSGVAQAERTGSEFVSQMRAVAQSIASANGTVTMDDLRRYAAENDIEPHDPHAWGSILTTRSGWTCVGRTLSKLQSNHAREIKVWAQTKPNQNSNTKEMQCLT